MNNYIYASYTNKEYRLKEDTKTVFELVETTTSNITEEVYNNITDKKTLQFFRGLGGSETATKNYTSKGYKIVQLVSKNPNKTIKCIRTFDLNVDSKGVKLW
jgi:hypothetical protein